jgi:hypothetical protein
VRQPSSSVASVVRIPQRSSSWAIHCVALHYDHHQHHSSSNANIMLSHPPPTHSRRQPTSAPDFLISFPRRLHTQVFVVFCSSQRRCVWVVGQDGEVVGSAHTRQPRSALVARQGVHDGHKRRQDHCRHCWAARVDLRCAKVGHC